MVYAETDVEHHIAPICIMKQMMEDNDYCYVTIQELISYFIVSSLCPYIPGANLYMTIIKNKL